VKRYRRRPLEVEAVQLPPLSEDGAASTYAGILPNGVSLSPATPSEQVRTNRLLLSVFVDHEDRLDRIEAELRRRGYKL
jgi:hypothetical protein